MELKQTVCSVLIRSVADSKSLTFVAMKMKYYSPPPPNHFTSDKHNAVCSVHPMKHRVKEMPCKRILTLASPQKLMEEARLMLCGCLLKIVGS